MTGTSFHRVIDWSPYGVTGDNGDAMTFFSDWPYPLAVATLFVIVMLRANGTYWLGRGLRTGARRTRLTKLVDSPGFGRAENLIGRWGAPVVTLCFLTVGVQTMVNLAAGATRMPLRRYLPAVTVGSVIWAFIYATVGFVTVQALVLVHRQSPLLFWIVVVVLIALVVLLVWFNLYRREPSDPEDRSAPRSANP